MDTTQSSAIEPTPSENPPKRAKKGAKADDESRRLSSSLELSDHCSLKISIGTRATNTDAIVANMQETRQKNSESQLKVIMMLREDNDHDTEVELSMLKRYKDEAKELDEGIKELKKKECQFGKKRTGHRAGSGTSKFKGTQRNSI